MDETIVDADTVYRPVGLLDGTQEFLQSIQALLVIRPHTSSFPARIAARSRGTWPAQASFTVSRLILPREVRGIASTTHQRAGILGSARWLIIHACSARI